MDYKAKLKGKEKVYHVNMLKTWTERPENMKTEENFLATIDVIEEKEDDYLVDIDIKVSPQVVGKETVDDGITSSELNDEQKDQLSELLTELSDAFTDVPKKTNLIQHKVKLTTDKPVYRKPYPIPYALTEKVQQELNDMLKLGIIEPTTSPYAAPIVILKKKDSSLRVCVDYRELNKITEFDPRPMPKIDDVLHKIGKAKWVSKIDLT